MSTDTRPKGETPKPLPCRLAELLKEWKQVRDDFTKKGNDEAALAVECCAENLHEVIAAFFADAKAWHGRQDASCPPQIGPCVIAYKSGVTGLRMWVDSVGTDPQPGDEFGRNIRGANTLPNAHVFAYESALEMLPKVREVHLDAWIERADGTAIEPHPADL